MIIPGSTLGCASSAFYYPHTSDAAPKRTRATNCVRVTPYSDALKAAATQPARLASIVAQTADIDGIRTRFRRTYDVMSRDILSPQGYANFAYPCLLNRLGGAMEASDKSCSDTDCFLSMLHYRAPVYPILYKPRILTHTPEYFREKNSGMNTS